MFSWSYHALDRDQAEVFGLLGLAPGPDISLPAAASLTALPIPRIRAVLRGVGDASLIQQHVPGRYRMHDLIRLYAVDQAHHDLPPEQRDIALRRLVDFYLHTAYAAERLLDPHREPVKLDPPAPGCHPHPLADETAALAWLDAEHACLLAAQHLAGDQGWHHLVWQLAWALHTFHERRGHVPGPSPSGRPGWPPPTSWATRPSTPRPPAPRPRLRLVGRHAEALEHLHRV